MAFILDEEAMGNAVIFCMGEAGARVADLAAVEWPQGLSQVKCVVWSANEGTEWSEEVWAEVEKAETVMFFADAEDRAAAAAARSILDAADRKGATAVCIVTTDDGDSAEDHRMGNITPENGQEVWENASATAWLPRKANEHPEELLWPVFRLAVRLVFESNFINLDIVDICSILAGEDHAYVGVGSGNGVNKAEEAASAAISNLCAETEMSKVRGVIVSFIAASNIELDDIDKCSEKIIDSVHPEAIIVWGAAFDDRMNDEMTVIVLATNTDDIDAKLDELLKQLNSRPAEENSHASETSADQDPHQTAMIYKQKAEQGDVEAMMRLAECYAEGKGLERDEEQAFWWYQNAAEQGHAEAQCALGYFYLDGTGVHLDYRKSAEWFQKAAEQGDAEAQFVIGYCHDKGSGEQQDQQKAVGWYQKAAEQGRDTAQFFLGCCYEFGTGVTEDQQKADEWYRKAAEGCRKAAEQGDAIAQSNLGFCYENGTGVPQNYQKAIEWYLKAAKQNHAAAQYHLGDCYEYGKGVPQDDQRAAKWYSKAAEQRDSDAQYAMGRCYDYGIGVPKDEEKAAEWYRKAEQDDVMRAAHEILAFLNNPGTDGSQEDEQADGSTAATH